MTAWIEQFNTLSFSEFPDFFSRLQHDDSTRPDGFFKATFIGPGWLRRLSPLTLSLSGMHGWWGKQFMSDGTTYNLVKPSEQLKRSIAMRLTTVTSALDNRPAFGVIYPREAPFPWRYVIDELRWLDQTALLGMMHVNNNLLQKIAFPFLLQSQEGVYGL